MSLQQVYSQNFAAEILKVKTDLHQLNFKFHIYAHFCI